MILIRINKVDDDVADDDDIDGDDDDKLFHKHYTNNMDRSNYLVKVI